MYRKLILIASLLLLPLYTRAVTVDVNELLAASDRARGGAINGLTMVSTVSSIKKGKRVKSYTLKVESDDGNNLITFEKPARSKGTRMLMIERNMWFISPDVSKPVPISPRQRLLGDANTGDIATTNYRQDYDAALLSVDTVDGEKVYVLELKAKNDKVSYDKIHYYISKESKLGIKAEYFTVSGKKLKTARLYYENLLNYEGEEIRFVSRIEISEELKKGKKTELSYSNITLEDIPASKFKRALRGK